MHYRENGSFPLSKFLASKYNSIKYRGSVSEIREFRLKYRATIGNKTPRVVTTSEIPYFENKNINKDIN
jgi:hypothetical protein